MRRRPGGDGLGHTEEATFEQRLKESGKSRGQEPPEESVSGVGKVRDSELDQGSWSGVRRREGLGGRRGGPRQSKALQDFGFTE